MRALVIYESMFGNTETIAREVASGLESAGAEVTVAPVTQADPDTLADYDVVVAGAPTHAFSLPRPATRADAVRQGADPAHAGPGLREWLDRLEPSIGARPTFAVFDTRMGSSSTARRVTGSASKRAVRTLLRRHRALADHPTSFYVGGTAGPLLPGEDARARAWGRSLVGCRVR